MNKTQAAAGRTLLAEALELYPGKLADFARTVMVRDRRTVERWQRGDVPIPRVARERLEDFIRDAQRARARRT